MGVLTMADEIVRSIVDKLYGEEPETYTLSAEEIQALHTLITDLRTPTPVYLPGEFGGGYEMGRDGANENTADTLTGILPFLRED